MSEQIVIKKQCPDCKKDVEQRTCSDCGQTIQVYHRCTVNTEGIWFYQGTHFSKCNICDNQICEDCFDEHAENEAFG